ncbi:MAG: carboxylesterase/lipase family protein [Spirosomataceae bacterium]
MKNWIATLALGMMGFSSLQAQHTNGFDVQTRIQSGIIEGIYDTHTGVQKYLGIPFAQPPVGELRWKAPQPVKPWTGVKKTQAFGPRPMQTMVFGDMKSRSNGVSEDCLYLNVWTPTKRNTPPLPVLVYFYGGGNVAGDGSEPRYDGEAMAKKGIVVVTCNYRLNIFGNFAHPELSAESPTKSSGNYGYLDQLAALQWVKANIAQFGGDPNQVTIAGESAGSISVSYHVASPKSKGLFHRAIGESGAGIHPTMAPITLPEAEKQGAEFVKQAGIPSLAALRKMSTREIYEVYNDAKRFGFPVVIDGSFIPRTLPEQYARKEHNAVPLLVGWNSAEIPGMAFMQGKPYTPEAFRERIQKEYPQHAETVAKLYPHADAKEVEYSATDLASDRFIVYATWKWADLHKSSAPVYRYLYSHPRPPLVDANLTSGFAGGTQVRTEKAPEPIGAPHACEIEYCMGNLHLVKDYAWTPADYQVSQVMSDYFANFIKTGNPNGGKLPDWPAMDPKSSQPAEMILKVNSQARPAPNEARYQFLDTQYLPAK